MNYNIKFKNADSGGKKTPFPSISSLIGRAFPIIRVKMDGPIPSEVDIKVSITAPIFYLQFKKGFFP